MLNNLLFIFIGGGLGSVARYLVSHFISLKFEGGIPWGTFAVNIVGSLLLGLFIGLAQKYNLASSQFSILFTVGFCGGFTTFSTFAYENVLMMRQGDYMMLALYTGLSVVLGLAMAFVGLAAVK